MTADRQLGLLWGLVAIATLALSPLASTMASGLPPCPVRTVAGVPCPGCGTTRAALALARFDLVAAWQVNPLATVGAVLFLGGGLVALLSAMFGKGVPNRIGPLPLPARLAGVAVILANWLYLVRSGV